MSSSSGDPYLELWMQFYDKGCENCTFLSLEGDQDRCSECTTPHFQGVISFIDPPASWAAKWTHSSASLFASPICTSLLC